MGKKQILIINTGGTISSAPTKNGLAPVTGYMKTALSDLPALKHPELPEFHIKEYNPLIDSANMTIDVWNQLVQDIAINYKDLDGFIILHGTDTMAYTASALSFMLMNIGKPVILTGSLLPLTEVRNDAIGNIVTSLLLCAHYPIHEVCVYFNQKLLRGNRTRKLHAHHFDAFSSPNFPPLATVGIQVELAVDVLLPKPMHAIKPTFMSPNAIVDFWLFPGFNIKALEYLTNMPIKALVLATYGAGNAPNLDLNFNKIIKKAHDAKILVINTTQCLIGHVDATMYSTGRALSYGGVISANNMTPEAIHGKLLYIFSVTADFKEAESIFKTNLCGEL